MNYKRLNPRFDHPFSVTINFGEYLLNGQATNPSAFGASVEISTFAYEHLQENKALWEKNRRVTVVTALNDLPGSINCLYMNAGKFYLSLKLLDNRSWYN